MGVAMLRIFRGWGRLVALTTVAALALTGCGATKEASSHRHLELTLVYASGSESAANLAQVVQQELGDVGVKVTLLAVPGADLYTKYLTSETAVKSGAFDIAITGWGPDWYGDNAATFFLPLFNGSAAFPWNGGANNGMYDNPVANRLIQAAVTAPAEKAPSLWEAADRQVMKDAAIYPIAESKGASYVSRHIANAIGMPVFGPDPLNVTKTGPDSSTLHLLGSGDVDYLDPTITYTALGYEASRFYARQLFTYPAIPGHTTDVAADLATEIPTRANGGISADGKTITVHLRSGVLWNTTPARPVTAADVVLGVKRSCNPVLPFGGDADFSSLIEGYSSFCAQFAKDAGSEPTAESMKRAIAAPLPGVTAPNATTVVYRLTRPVAYFVPMLAGLPALSAPIPTEYLDYLPGSAALAQHTLSDGPYVISSYAPAQSIVFTANPLWKQSTDPIRKQNFQKVMVNETGAQGAIQLQLQSGSSSADMDWGTGPLTSSVPGLVAAHDPGLVLTSNGGLSTYLVFNTASPKNAGALSDPRVRGALSQALDRTALIKVIGGPSLNRPLTQVLPEYSGTPMDFDLWPFNPAKAKADLAAALK